MKKLKVIAPILNVRKDTAAILDTNYIGFLTQGTVFFVEEQLTGEKIGDQDIWYRDQFNRFYWSGGTVEAPADPLSIFNAYRSVNLSLISWNDKIAQIPVEWRNTKGKGVKIAILDSGIFDKHEDFSGSITVYEDLTPVSEKMDFAGHGTHVAGIIGGRSKTVNGVIGIAPEAELIIVKVLFDEADGVAANYQHIIDALDIAVSKGADIINLSLSLRKAANDQETAQLKIKELTDKIKQITSQNILVVAAGGDKADLKKGELFFPAENEAVLSVAAINKDYFTRNPVVHKNLNIVGPFVNYFSTFKAPEFYQSLPGCSMTTAFVSGIAALAIAANRRSANERFSKTAVLAMLQPHSLSLDAIDYTDNTTFSYHLLNA